MTRLTKKVGNKVYAIEECNFMPFGNAAKAIRKILNKLNKYENIGDPSDLIRPVRCGECAYRNYDEPENPGCGNWGYPTKDNDYCSWGRKAAE